METAFDHPVPIVIELRGRRVWTMIAGPFAVILLLVAGLGCNSPVRNESQPTPIPVGQLPVMQLPVMQGYCPLDDAASSGGPASPPEPADVLFEVESDLDGPWRVGVLLSDDGLSWSPPRIGPAELSTVPALDSADARIELRTYAKRWLPVLSRLDGARWSDAIRWHSGTEVVLAPDGEISAYSVSAADVPSIEELRRVPDGDSRTGGHPPAPAFVNELVQADSTTPWSRYDDVRTALLDGVVAEGTGVPGPIAVARAEDLLDGGTGDPFEIVAVSALLARWSGFPSRIGYGYDGGFRTEERLQVTEAYAAYFVEIEAGVHGWIPILATPLRAVPCS